MAAHKETKVCEVCWANAFNRAQIDGKTQTEHYAELLKEVTHEFDAIMPEETQ